MAEYSPRVAVLIDSSSSWGNRAIRGVVDFVRTSGRWIFQVDSFGVHEEPRLPRNWRGDGVIARVTNRTLARQIKSYGVPAVNVSWSSVPGIRLPQVTTDEQAVSRLAVEHFRERGIHNFAYVGQTDQKNYIDRCGLTFVEFVATYGYECDCFFPPGTMSPSSGRSFQLDELVRWLKRLPKPAGVFTWDAVRGRQVTEACWKSGIHVPDEVAVLAGHDDDLMCEISVPPLSGIDLSPERVGYVAAEALHGMMRGNVPPVEPKYIPPAGVVVRCSTDTLAHEDRDLVKALLFIREHADKPISVEHVVSHVLISRRSLEKRFLQALGRSPAAEIRRVHLQRAKDLLAQTDLPIPTVADSSGFFHPEVMIRAFCRESGVTPAAYRRQHRTR